MVCQISLAVSPGIDVCETLIFSCKVLKDRPTWGFVTRHFTSLCPSVISCHVLRSQALWAEARFSSVLRHHLAQCASGLRPGL